MAQINVTLDQASRPVGVGIIEPTFYPDSG